MAQQLARKPASPATSPSAGIIPSLCHDELLAQFPEIDSVVRYEGEETLIELVERLRAGQEWRDIAGIAYLRGGTEVVATRRGRWCRISTRCPSRTGPYEPEHIGGFPTLPLLASRGCARRCSFCSIHTFYRTAPGKVVRVRKPEQSHRGDAAPPSPARRARLPVPGRRLPAVGQRRGGAGRTSWSARLHDSGLADKTIWKISCRAEYVEPELFAGDARGRASSSSTWASNPASKPGLEVLYKQMTVEQNLSARRRRSRSSASCSRTASCCSTRRARSSRSARTSGSCARSSATDRRRPLFCRMLPYGGTPIRDQLAKEGRLRGDLTHPDYDFLDLRLNEYHRLLTRAVRPWIHKQGLAYEIELRLGRARDDRAARSRLRTAPTLTAPRCGRSPRRAMSSCSAWSRSPLSRSSSGDRSLLDAGCGARVLRADAGAARRPAQRLCRRQPRPVGAGNQRRLRQRPGPDAADSLAADACPACVAGGARRNGSPPIRDRARPCVGRVYGARRDVAEYAPHARARAGAVRASLRAGPATLVLVGRDDNDRATSGSRRSARA